MSSKHRFARPKHTLLLLHGASATAYRNSGDENGLLRQVIITAPAAVDSAATLDVSITDSDDNVIYSKTGLNAASTTIDLLADGSQVPLSGTYLVEVAFSAAQDTTDTTTVVVLLIDRG